MLDLALVIQRLQSHVESGAALRAVQGAAQLANVRGALTQRPGAFVYLVSEDAGENRLLNAIEQRVVVTFATLLVVRNVSDARGEAAQADLRPVRLAVRSALLNWTPDGETFAPAQFRSGRFMQMTDQILWWQDTWRTDYHIRKS